MNVLVYSGPGVSKTSLAYTLTTLRTLLLPHYTVQTITSQSLASDPWLRSCALLVLPGGRDLPYVSSLADANARIKSYVNDGGAFLGICAGAYYASKRVEWEAGTPMQVVGTRPLGFFPGTSRGCVYPGFEYDSENGARAVSIEMPGSVLTSEGIIYYNGGGEFVGAENVEGVQVIARYTDDGAKGKVAAVRCQVGKGNAVLWALHPEYPLKAEPAALAIAKLGYQVSSDWINRAEETRWKLMQETLSSLGLVLPSQDQSGRKTLPRPLPQFLVAEPVQPDLVSRIMKPLRERLSQAEPQVLQDSNNIFYFHSLADAERLLRDAREDPSEEDIVIADPTALLSKSKSIIVCTNGELPPRDYAPLFDLKLYFEELAIAREKISVVRPPDVWESGEALLYSEVVTSTQTMLDKNSFLLSTLPTPLVSIASQQLTGRGRGGNTWLSPAGCLQFSILLRVSTQNIPAHRLVFIQYLFGLAVVDACRDDAVLGKTVGQKVRLKWPNDLYAVTGDGDGDRKKIGGILVSTSFRGEMVDIVIGCGLNVLNPPPIASLFQLIPPGVNIELTMERVAGVIMATFANLWRIWFSSRGSFELFMDPYHEIWLHSDQLVTLTTVNPPVKARIVGITSQYGLLRVIPENVGGRHSEGLDFYDLQPDGNSFDLMSGLIKMKT